MRRLKVFTWHIHGSYLYYLSQANIDFYIPKKEIPEEGYWGKTDGFLWPKNLHEISAEEVKNETFDVILYQSEKNFLIDRYEILSPIQRTLPSVYLEHNPPRLSPTDTSHITKDNSLILVHVTSFNNLMWDSGSTPTAVIDHGVTIPSYTEYIGEKEKGIVVINNIQTRGRRLGYDLLKKIKEEIPLDIVGMNSEEIGGLGEIPLSQLPEFISHYRFFLNPIRYTSLGLSLIEAMMVGLPIVGYATTEIPTVITNDVTGFIHTDTKELIRHMKILLENKTKAKTMGLAAKQFAQKRFSIDRFTKEWEKVFEIAKNSQPNKMMSINKEGAII